MASQDGSQRNPKKDSQRRRSQRERVPWFVRVADYFDPAPLFQAPYLWLVGTPADSRDVRRRRRRWQAALGLAAVLAVAGGVAWKIGLFDGPAPPTLAALREQTDAALAGQDYAGALALCEQMAAQGDNTEQTRYDRALCLAALERGDEAVAIMEGLAAEPRPNFPPARLWLANRLLKKTKLTTEEREQVESHLTSATSVDPGNVEAQRRLADVLIAQGKLREALLPQERAAEKNPDDRLRLAKILYRLGDKSEGESVARLALAELSAQLDRQPADFELRRSVAQSAALLGDYEQAERALREGYKRADDKFPQFEKMLSELYCVWSLDRLKEGQAGQAIELLQMAERLAPKTGLIYATLARMAAMPAAEAEEARTALLASLARGAAPAASIHRILAALAKRGRRLRESHLHWQCVAQLNPEETVALNELARELNDRDPAAALAMIDRAVAVADKPALRGTRGLILTTLGRPAEAISDLNVALKADPQNAGLHAALYQAYALHKMPDLAAQHLAASAQARPELMLSHARLIASRGEAEAANAQAKKAAAFFSAKLEKDPRDITARLQMAEAALFLKEYAAALKLLEQGKEFPPADLKPEGAAEYANRLNRAASLVHLAWSTETGPAAPKEADAQRVARLASSLAADPVNALTLNSLQAIADAGGPQAPAARKALEPVLSKNTQALELLALASLKQQPPDAARGLDWLDKALKIDPQSASLRGARARVLSAMGKFTAAQPDIEQALAALPDSPELHAAAFEIYRGLEQQERAIKHLELAADASPALKLVYARYLDSLADRQGAREAAQEARQAFEVRLASAPADRLSRLMAAEAASFLGDAAGAVTTLQEGLRLNPQDSELKRALAQAYFLWSQADRPAPAAPMQKAPLTAAGLERVGKALEYDPENRAALTLLFEAGRVEGPVTQAARQKFEQLLDGAAASAAALFVAASQAWVEGQQKQALDYMERCYKIDPKLPDAANNLAWMLQSGDGDLTRAAKLAEEALVRSPQHPSYRGTRGHIRAKQGMWAEARADLEFALKARPDPENQKTLAEVYKKLGLTGPASDPKKEPKKELENEPKK